MDINDLHPPDDYSHRFFIWHEWIQVSLFFSMIIPLKLNSRTLGEWAIDQRECVRLLCDLHVLR